MLRTKSDRIFMVIIYIVVAIFAVACLYPLLLTLMTSITDEQTLIRNGYKLFPAKHSLAAYEMIATTMGSKVLGAYKITVFVTVVGTALSLFVTASVGYVVSVRDFKQRNFINMLLYIPMVFSASLLPWYLVCTKYYQLTNTMWALILPPCLNVFNVFLMRNFFFSLPQAVFESARIDGAGHFRFFFRIAIPMAQVGIITVGMMYALSYWNDYYNALMFIRKSEMYPMQYYLYNILSNIQFAARQSQTRTNYNIAIPAETIKMAIILSLALLLSVVGTASANVIDPALVPEETGEITVYMYGDKTPRMQELCADEYAKVFLEEINCVVNIEYISWSEYGAGNMTDRMILSGEPFDATWTDKDWLTQSVNKGYVQPWKS